MTETLHAALLPALFAGLVAIGVTRAIERWGGVVGGFFGTLPSTIVPASIGIASQALQPADFAAAMAATPAGMLVNAGFLYLWRTVPPRLPAWSVGARLALMIPLTLSAWATGAVAVVAGMRAAAQAGLSPVALGVTLTVITIGIGVAACWHHHPAPRGRRPVPLPALLARGLLAATAIGVSVAIAHAGGGLAAGVAAVFPAIFLTTMVSLWLAQGEAVPAGAVGPMMLGSAAVSTYALVAAATIPALGPALGAASAWLVAATTTTLPSWWWLHHRKQTR